jgi:hypothetical protein
MSHPTQDLFDFDVHDASEPQARLRRTTYVDHVVDQIKRDLAVLREDPCYHVPSRAFYEARITAYRQIS